MSSGSVAGVQAPARCWLNQVIVLPCRQYRMAADVMLLSNELVYGGRLVCGSEAVATAQLQLPLLQQVQGQLPAWLLPALDPARRVLFLDTDALPARDQVGGPSSCTRELARMHTPSLCCLHKEGHTALVF
jgi:hypothetical protein